MSVYLESTNHDEFDRYTNDVPMKEYHRILNE